MRFYLRRRSRLNQSILPAKNLRVEQLESRLLLHAAGLFEAHALFAPGTSIEYADEVHQLAHQIAQEYSSDDTSGHAHGDGCCCPDCSAVSSIAQFQFNDGNRWGGTTQSGGGLGQGDPTVVTWSIVPDGTNINGFVGEAASPSNLVSTFRGIYGIFDDPTDTNYVGEAWFEAIVSAFDRWSEVSGLEYVYESNDDGANFGFFNGVDGVRGDIRVGGHNIDGNSGTLAYNFFPNTSDMVIDTSDAFFNDTSNDSLRLRNVIAHEAGHGMGISHVESNNASFLMEPFINLGFDGPQFDDILATHRGYGDALEGNDSFATATDLGAFSDGDSMVIGADAFDTFVSATDTSFVSIDDDSDVDFFSFTVSGISTLDVMVDPIGPTYNQGAQNGSQSVFVASEQSDLRLEVYDRDGTTLIGESNVGGLGASELLSEIQLSGAGEYFIAVRGADNAAQMYRLELGVAESVSTPGVTIFESSGSTEVIEGGSSDSYSVVLNAAPINDVTIAIQSTSDQVTLDTSFLVFNSTNWNVAQTVTVTANDDDTNEGDHSDVIRHSIAESGFDYNGIEIAGIQVAISDNDATPVGEEFFFSLKGGGVLEGLS
ncbi:MAG: matrixin family metalloprotease, partial [Planctomycetota bacterium]